MRADFPSGKVPTTRVGNMLSSRGFHSSYDCIVKIKGVTMRSILFSQLMRGDGEGMMNPEELFAGNRTPASEQERVHEDELHSLMRSNGLGDILPERARPGHGVCGSGMRICWRNGTRSGTGPSSRPTFRAAIPPECGGAASAATVGSCP